MGGLPFVVFLPMAVFTIIATHKYSVRLSCDTLVQSAKIPCPHDRERDGQNNDNGSNDSGYFPPGHSKINCKLLKPSAMLVVQALLCC
jgi:hypothetical protein